MKEAQRLSTSAQTKQTTDGVSTLVGSSLSVLPKILTSGSGWSVISFRSKDVRSNTVRLPLGPLPGVPTPYLSDLLKMTTFRLAQSYASRCTIIMNLLV
jgi:hypothetical protein